MAVRTVKMATVGCVISGMKHQNLMNLPPSAGLPLGGIGPSATHQNMTGEGE